MTLIKDLPDGSSTQLWGLNRQMIHQVIKIMPGILVDLSDLNIFKNEGLIPFAHPKLKKALSAAIESHGQAIAINNAWRPVTTQAFFYNLKQTGRGMQNNLVGRPGRSNHQGAASVDLPDWEALKNLMNSHWFTWTYGEADAMHFDCILVTNDERDLIKMKTNLAFQQLWNQCGMKPHLDEDGQVGDQTLQALLNAPAEGFPGYDECPRFLKLTTPNQLGKDVGKLQLFLKKNGAELKADTIFGEATDKALRAFQESHNLTVDGIVGDQMWKVINGNN